MYGKELEEYDDFKVVVQKSLNPEDRDLNLIVRDDKPFLYLKDLQDCKDVANVLSVYFRDFRKVEKEKNNILEEIQNLREEYLEDYSRLDATLEEKARISDKLSVLTELNNRISILK